MRPAGTFSLLAAIAAAQAGLPRGLVRPVAFKKAPPAGKGYAPHSGERQRARVRRQLARFGAAHFGGQVQS